MSTPASARFPYDHDSAAEVLGSAVTSTAKLTAGQGGSTVIGMVQWEAFEARRSATPVYRQLADWVAGEIKAGRLEKGTQIPAERRLAELVGVSVDTVRAAMAALREAGLVETGHGTGSFVR